MTRGIEIAALYVQTGGCYYDLPGVDPWDEARDARKYDGPHPVVAHPPCARWGRFWYADGSSRPGKDGGLFEAALDAVTRWGGVLEHPEASYAWHAHMLGRPVLGAWLRVLRPGPVAWTTCVPQGNYGHRARKLTWLLLVGHPDPPRLNWSMPQPQQCYLRQPRAVDEGRCHSVERMCKRERDATPPAFRDLLLDLARHARGG